MKITYLQVSNVLSFPYCENIKDAEKLTFDDNFNIIIGENGSGKSTALEIINFLFKRVLYKQYIVNQEEYSRKSMITADEKRNIVQPANNQKTNGFRLDPNWDSETKTQTIRIEVKLDEIDETNLKLLRHNASKLSSVARSYTNRTIPDLSASGTTYLIDVILSNIDQKFKVNLQEGESDAGFEYLTDYQLYKELIALHNLENPSEQIATLYESFTLIGGYRNYHAFNRSVSLKDALPAQQIQQIRAQEYSRSTNTSEGEEPSIFGVVRLRVAELHFNLIVSDLSERECEERANNLPFIKAINEKLAILKLECRIRMIEQRTWRYSFEFFDSRRNKILNDVNSLSAGQKAIIHLVFEAYGRGDLKGGVVIIDEPEIHLHYQFQHEYVQVIKALNKEQNCQYILVTHSEALINSSTISYVKRFSLDSDGHTRINNPNLTTDQRVLIKVLDNTRTTYAFFGKKVLLVEGDTDRYFFKAVLQELYPALDQEIAVLHMGGKGAYTDWSLLFESFGLAVHCAADFDFIVDRSYRSERGTPLKMAHDILAFKGRHPDWETRIEADYSNRVYILKHGDLETYLGIHKGLTETIEFCNNQLMTFLADDSNAHSLEIRDIVRRIAT